MHENKTIFYFYSRPYNTNRDKSTNKIYIHHQRMEFTLQDIKFIQYCQTLHLGHQNLPRDLRHKPKHTHSKSSIRKIWHITRPNHCNATQGGKCVTNRCCEWCQYKQPFLLWHLRVRMKKFEWVEYVAKPSTVALSSTPQYTTTLAGVHHHSWLHHAL